MKELEAHTALFQHLVQRGKDDIAHAGTHAPEQSPTIRKEHAHRAAQRHAGRQPRTLHVAIFERKREIVDSAHESRVERLLGRAIHAKPLAPIVVVDGVEAARIECQAVQRCAPQDCKDEIDHLPNPPQLAVIGHEAFEVISRGRRQAFDELEGNRGARPEHLRKEHVDRLSQNVTRFEERGSRRQLTVTEEPFYLGGEPGRPLLLEGMIVPGRSRGCRAPARFDRAGGTQQFANQQRRLAQVVEHGRRTVLWTRIARLPLPRRKMREPELPPFTSPIHDRDIRRRLECIVPIGEPTIRMCLSPLRVALPHEPKRILIETHPQVETMLLDPIGASTARSTLAPESPSHLIDGHFVPTLVLRPGQLEGRGEGCAAPANHGDTYGVSRIAHRVCNGESPQYTTRCGVPGHSAKVCVSA